MAINAKKKSKSVLEVVESRLQKAFGRGENATLVQAQCLYKIQAQELYLSVAKTMGAYGRKKWRISPAYTSRLSAAGGVYLQLRPVWKQAGAVKPSSESQLRPLTLLTTKEEMSEAWLKAVAAGAGAAPTAKDVAIEVQTILRARGVPGSDDRVKPTTLKLNFAGKEYLHDYLVEHAKKAMCTPAAYVMEKLERYCPVSPPVAPPKITVDETNLIAVTDDQTDAGEYDIDPAYLPLWVTILF